MKCLLTGLALLAVQAATSPALADETLKRLEIGSEVYSNVTVMQVTATDIYFSHSRGVGNAKLKDLSADLQKHFNFNATNAAAVIKRQREANAAFRQDLIASTAAIAAAQAGGSLRAITNDDGDLEVSKLYARSVRGQTPPQINIPDWLTPPPDVEGKFVLVVFWATWAEPCRNGIAHLNDLQSKFKDRLLVIGLSDEPPDQIVKMTSPRIRYWVGTDVGAQTRNALDVTALPHSILIDPKGVVRFEGSPDLLNDYGVAHVIEKYSD